MVVDSELTISSSSLKLIQETYSAKWRKASVRISDMKASLKDD